MLAATPLDEPVTVPLPRSAGGAGEGAAGAAVEVARAPAAAVLAVEAPLAEPPHPAAASGASTDAATRAERLRACIANSFDVRAADFWAIHRHLAAAARVLPSAQRSATVCAREIGPVRRRRDRGHPRVPRRLSARTAEGGHL